MDFSSFNVFPFPVLIIDKNFRVVFKNKKALEVYGDNGEFCYTLSHGIDHPCTPDQEHICPLHEIETHSISHCGVLHVHKTLQGDKYFYVFAQKIRDDLFLELHMDVSDLVSSLGVSKISPELLLSSGPMVFFLWENAPGWPVKVVSPNVYNLFGYTASEFISGKVTYSELIHPEDLPRVSEEVERYTKTKAPFWTHEDYRVITKDGKVRWVLDHTVALFNDSKDITHYYGYIVDITEKHEKEGLFRQLAQSNPNGVMLFDYRRNRILYANKAMVDMTQYSLQELLSMGNALELVHPKDRHKVKRYVSLRLEGNREPFSYEIRLITKGGESKWVKVLSSVITYKGEECTLVTLIDITKEKIREKELRRLATRDYLTGIYNRHALVMFLEKLISSAQRYRNKFSVILMDIDNFKSINDRFGHNVGDRVLRELSKVIDAKLRKTDIFGRWGGEEFLIVLPFTRNPQPVAEKLRRSISKHRFTGVERVTVSFGATVYREDDTMESLLSRADKALYKAKEEGKNRTVVL